MWKDGNIEINGETYRWDAKVFEKGSKFGIADGVISKLSIRNSKNVEVCLYDRGWIREPETLSDLLAYREVLKLFTSMESEEY